jgi:hypothetical protein
LICGRTHARERAQTVLSDASHAKTPLKGHTARFETGLTGLLDFRIPVGTRPLARDTADPFGKVTDMNGSGPSVTLPLNEPREQIAMGASSVTNLSRVARGPSSFLVRMTDFSTGFSTILIQLIQHLTPAARVTPRSKRPNPLILKSCKSCLSRFVPALGSGQPIRNRRSRMARPKRCLSFLRISLRQVRSNSKCMLG